MAITSSAKKAIRSSARKRIFNLRRKQALDATLKSIRRLVKQGSIGEAKKLLPQTYKALDKASKTNYLKKNTAARLKSRITLLLNKVSSK
jgi:small subunit ribosomal protein S20